MATASSTPPIKTSTSGAKPEADRVIADMAESYNQGGAMGMLDRVGSMMEQRFDELYSSANMNRMLDKIMDSLPEELREGLSQFFNMLSGADDERTNETSLEYQALGELYGAGGATNDGVRMAANFAQRDDANFASGVTIGTGMGAITEVNGIQYVNGKAVNDANEDEGAELMSEMGEQSGRDRERIWDEQKHGVAGMELTGEEIDGMIEMLNDPAQRQKLIERRAKEKGISEKEAAADFDKAERLLKLTKLRETGKLTPAQEAEWTQLNNDPKTRDTAEFLEKMASEREVTHINPNARVSQSDKAGAVNAGADALDQAFATAPVLRTDFAEAKAATAPLASDQPEKQPLLARVAPSATPPPQAASAGFDV